MQYIRHALQNVASRSWSWFRASQAARLVAIVVVAAIGVAALRVSGAATPTATFEAEAGTRTSGAVVATDGTASGGSAVQFTASRFSPSSLYVDPNSHAAAQAVTWQTSNSAGAVIMQKLAAVPMAAWAANIANADIQSAASNYVGQAAAAGKLPVVVAYNIPGRDCGNYSAGGASSVADYQQWLQNFANGIGTRPAIVIIEPDALSQLHVCLTTAQQTDRVNMLSYAVTTFKALPHTYVYIDAGNPSANSVATIATRLQQANIAAADGFSLNVSGFQTTAENVAYGDAVSAQVGGKHYVIDTSRNGNGAAPDAEWCNPPGRALGQTPTLTPGLGSAVDALLWVKIPGESDGSCNGGPASGVWWPEYALGLAQSAGW